MQKLFAEKFLAEALGGKAAGIRGAKKTSAREVFKLKPSASWA